MFSSRGLYQSGELFIIGLCAAGICRVSEADVSQVASRAEWCAGPLGSPLRAAGSLGALPNLLGKGVDVLVWSAGGSERAAARVQGTGAAAAVARQLSHLAVQNGN